MLFAKNLIFTLLVPGTVGGYVPWLMTREATLAPSEWVLPGSILMVTGAALYLWCVWDFAVSGRGTPAPIDPPRKLVVRGAYLYTRNPMYTGVLTVILGWIVVFQSPGLLIYMGSVWATVHLFVIFYEEPHLHRTFGIEYADYCARVGRWIPRIGQGRSG